MILNGDKEMNIVNRQFCLFDIDLNVINAIANVNLVVDCIVVIVFCVY